MRLHLPERSCGLALQVGRFLLKLGRVARQSVVVGIHGHFAGPTAGGSCHFSLRMGLFSQVGGRGHDNALSALQGFRPFEGLDDDYAE
jgi:hypothetical protein